jgi:AAA+ ATPase superfamily predicted ATPase
MPKDYSPFTPGQPVVLEFFVGRAEQARAMLRHVKASAGGRVEIIFVSGERGIGKTSLASFVRVAAERQEQMVGIHTFLGGVTDLEEMAARVFDRLLKESEDKPWHQKIVDFFGNRIQKVGLFGLTLEFKPRQDELRQIVHDFVPVLRNLARRLRGEKHGFLLILDDINGLASAADFANWLKSIVDEIATSREVVPLCLVLVGLEERRSEMIQHQPSLARVFRLVDVPLWSDEESAEFFRKAFQSVNLPVETKALEHIVNFSGGHPALAHEIGDAVFYADSDGYVDEHDAFETSSDISIWNRRFIELSAVRDTEPFCAPWRKETTLSLSGHKSANNSTSRSVRFSTIFCNGCGNWKSSYLTRKADQEPISFATHYTSSTLPWKRNVKDITGIKKERKSSRDMNTHGTRGDDDYRAGAKVAIYPLE